VNFFHTYVSPRAIELAAETLKSTYISEGKLVRQFEQELSRQFGLVQPVAVNSGTSALHLGLAIAGIRPGDEVVLSPQTFVASALAILMCGATPVFADIQPMTGNIDPASARAKITPRTKAIMPVHWTGYPCDMDELNALAREYSLVVIEDAAQALGATYKGRPIGSISRFTAFSFQAIKHLTTGDGGALCCLGEPDYLEARRRRWFGIDRERDQSSILGERQYDLTEVGFKYHLNDLGAAVGLGNLPDVRTNLARHRHIARTYREALAQVPAVTLLESRPDRESSYWVFTLLVERREDFVRALKSRGVPTSVVHQRIDRNQVFGGIKADLEGQDFFDARQIALPVHPGLSDQQIGQIIGAVREGW
jgi:perosamine synthetase